jgi:2,3-bisphosphoglycerate-independent phosphoglycerate mutase
MAKPLVLCILDGWGEAPAGPHNAISMAPTPTWDHLCQTYPKALLTAAAEAVGLPSGQMGNSEVGHMHIGAGRIIRQDLPRINHAITQGHLKDIDDLQAMINTLHATGKACHLLGLLSPGGVHSMQDHILELCRVLNEAHITTYVHAFLDGRDTPPTSAKGYLATFLQQTQNLPYVHLASLGGRYYGMDRDNRWERVQKAYQAIVASNTQTTVPRFADPLAYLQACYDNGITDEFINPAIATEYPGLQEQDALLCANFRADRVRQLLAALVTPGFQEFSIADRPQVSTALGLVSYSTELDAFMSSLFPPQTIQHTLGEVVSQAGLRQLRIAETEKYAHVTYFFNGGHESKLDNEDRIMIPSPQVATYDLRPEMSAAEVTDKLCEALEAARYDFIVVNYANGDMVGHTGDFAAALKAVSFLDTCLARLWQTIQKMGGDLLITADHGNVEMMVDPDTGTSLTSHTMNLVPLVLCSQTPVALKSHGSLIDIAPTILARLGVTVPEEMTGQCLILS